MTDKPIRLCEAQKVPESITRQIATTLKAHGFSKRRNTWIREQIDLTQVLELQLSDSCPYGFYINMGIYIKAVGDLKRPPESKCHIRRRPPRSDITTMLNSQHAGSIKRSQRNRLTNASTRVNPNP